jgi:hypothetical protein
MAVELFDWNVVVVGYWNPAILTPTGIAKRLFDLAEGIPITVEVPMDGLAPHRVRHEGIVVTAEPGRLALTVETPTLTNLERARRIAVRAIKALPETPLTAAGFNIRLKLDDPPQRLLRDTAAAIDTSLSDVGLVIKSRSIRRSLEHGKGTLNLYVRQSVHAETRIELNFDRQCTVVDELCGWLETPSVEIKRAFTTILDRVCGVDFQESWQ